MSGTTTFLSLQSDKNGRYIDMSTGDPRGILRVYENDFKEVFDIMISLLEEFQKINI